MFAEELTVELCDLVEGSQHRLRNSADRDLEQVNSRSICLGRLDRIEQVLINLLTNARYATAQQGNRQVHLQAQLKQGQVLLTVTDEGGGVPEHIREKLFDPFFTTKGSEGTGLGLSISTRIVHEHGGRLEIENVGPGARFTVFLRSV